MVHSAFQSGNPTLKVVVDPLSGYPLPAPGVLHETPNLPDQQRAIAQALGDDDVDDRQ
jgi:hypothetical protein